METNSTFSNGSSMAVSNVQYSIFAVTIPACLANLLAMVIFGRSVWNHGPVLNTFLFCLNCTDFLGCLYGIQAIIAPLYSHLFNPVVCSIVVFWGAFCGLLSALCAALMAIDRYFALCKPYSYGFVFTRKRAFVYICIILMIATFVCSLNEMGLGVSYTYIDKPDGSQTIICSSRIYQRTPHRRLFGYIYGILGALILLVVIYCNIRVISAVLKMKRNIQNLGSIRGTSGQASQTAQSEVKFARVIGGLSVVLLICWAPFMANAFLAQTVVQLNPSYITVTHILVTMNFMADPFVFLVLRKSYRQEAVQLLCGCLCQHPSPTDDTNAMSTPPTVVLRNQNKEGQGTCSTSDHQSTDS